MRSHYKQRPREVLTAVGSCSITVSVAARIINSHEYRIAVTTTAANYTGWFKKQATKFFDPEMGPQWLRTLFLLFLFPGLLTCCYQIFKILKLFHFNKRNGYSVDE